MKDPRPISEFKFTQDEYDLFINDVEIWRIVENYPSYDVSTFGNIRSNKINSKGSLFKLDTSGHGYLRVTFCCDGKPKKEPVHRIVAQAFVKNPDNKPQINHDDGIKDSNRPNNLFWCTQGENNSHAYRTGLSKGSAYGKRGALSHCSKPIAQFRKDGSFVMFHAGAKEAERYTGISSKRIGDNALGKKPGGGGFDWRFI